MDGWTDERMEGWMEYMRERREEGRGNEYASERKGGMGQKDRRTGDGKDGREERTSQFQ